jgi:organic hydroperoxide reductase OsmC/OhrA
MRPLPHEYDVALIGAPAGYATVSSTGLPDLTIAPPTAYDGPGDAWSPEHLLLAAVASCFLFTFRATAKASKTEFLAVDAETFGTVAKADGAIRFTDIVIRARVTAAAGADMEAARRVVDKAAARCLVSSSLKTPVRVEATVVSATRAA